MTEKKRLNTSAKGGRVERLCRDLLEKRGYTVSMFRLSKGAFDRIATRQVGQFGVSTGNEQVGQRCLVANNEIVIPTLQQINPELDSRDGQRKQLERRAIQIKANAWGMPAAAVQRAWELELPEPISREWWMRKDGRGFKREEDRWEARRLTGPDSWVTITLFEEENPYFIGREGWVRCPSKKSEEVGQRRPDVNLW